MIRHATGVARSEAPPDNFDQPGARYTYNKVVPFRSENAGTVGPIVVAISPTCRRWTAYSWRARSSSATPDLPVMMVTAYGDDERRRRAGELGGADFLPKPVDFDALKAQLR